MDPQVEDADRRADREPVADPVRGGEDGLRRDDVAVDQVIAGDRVAAEARALRVADIDRGAHHELAGQ